MIIPDNSGFFLEHAAEGKGFRLKDLEVCLQQIIGPTFRLVSGMTEVNCAELH